MTLILKIVNQFFPHDTPLYDNTPPYQVWEKMIARFRRYCANTVGHRDKISSGQTFTDILNLRCDLDLKRSTSIFPQDTPVYDAVLSDQV